MARTYVRRHVLKNRPDCALVLGGHTNGPGLSVIQAPHLSLTGRKLPAWRATCKPSAQALMGNVVFFMTHHQVTCVS